VLVVQRAHHQTVLLDQILFLVLSHLLAAVGVGAVQQEVLDMQVVLAAQEAAVAVLQVLVVQEQVDKAIMGALVMRQIVLEAAVAVLVVLD